MEYIGSRAFAGMPLEYMAFDLYDMPDIAQDAFLGSSLLDLDLPWDSSFENRDRFATLLAQSCPNCTVWINNPGSGCESLETVYLGPCTEEISGEAFLNTDGTPAFAQEDCITLPAQLPDVDALRAQVKSNPMPTPEPTATPAPAVPVGEAGEPFLGTWIGVSMKDSGVSFDLAEYGIEMTLELCADGTAALEMSGETEEAVWTVEGGAGLMEGQMLTLDGAGRLSVSADGSAVIFERADAQGGAPQAAQTPASTGAQAGEGSLQRLGVRFVMASAEVQGYTLSPAQLGNMEYSLLFEEDGTAEFVLAGTRVPQLLWTEQTVETDSGPAQAYVIDYYGTPLTPEGFDMDYFGSMLIHFEPEN